MLTREVSRKPSLRNVKTLNFIRNLYFAALKVTFHDEKPTFRNVKKLHFRDETPTSPGRVVSGQAGTGTPLLTI